MNRISKRLTISKNTSSISLAEFQQLRQEIDRLPDGDYKLIIEPITDFGIVKKRNYYFLCVDQLAAYLGYSKVEMNKEIKRCLPKEIVIENNQEVLKERSIATMTEKQLVGHIRDLHEWASLNFDFTFPDNETI